MNPKAEIFFDAITALPEDLVEEAQEHTFRKSRTPWVKFGSLAACLLLVVSLGVLAAVPRGCGGGAPAPENSSGASSADTCEPAEAPGAPNDVPQAPEDDGGEAFRFTAKVVEVMDALVLVEPLEGEEERNSADRITVAVNGEIPALKAGDLVEITYDGLIQESYPAHIPGASAIEKLEE